ncbi:MAG: putative chorismate pyruvate-lyase [Lysobacteraceae bacterium]|nr:MAG: putative chorismate pyruvate-lyase [Xanthomonadaceae bacterium]
MYDWLVDPSSLTARLRARFGAGFSVAVQQLSRAWPTLNETRLLGLSGRQSLYQRCVSLRAFGEPVVQARTLIPVRTLRGRARQLTRLGSRPLGQAVFSSPDMRRGPLQTALVHTNTPIFPNLDEPCWGRRSVFYLGGRPLLVYEVFLPRLFERLS